jgi:hypothetical protein
MCSRKIAHLALNINHSLTRSLDQYNLFEFYGSTCSSLKQQSAGRHVAPLGNVHIIMIPSQQVIVLIFLTAACLAEKPANTNFMV